jgi:Ca2+-binding EF-hand superfamily protein
MRNLHLTLSLAVSLLVAGCVNNNVEPRLETSSASVSSKGLFECINRNGNGYIDRSEHVYLRPCGITEDLACGNVPDSFEESSNTDTVQFGSRFLQLADADGDGRISSLELRAHCNNMTVKK